MEAKEFWIAKHVNHRRTQFYELHDFSILWGDGTEGGEKSGEQHRDLLHVFVPWGRRLTGGEGP